MIAILDTDSGKEYMRFREGSVGSNIPDLCDQDNLIVPPLDTTPPKYHGEFIGGVICDTSGRWELVKVEC